MYTLERVIPFVDAVFHVLEHNAPLDDAVAILRAAENQHQIQLLTPPSSSALQVTDAQYGALVEGHFYAFVSETHLVLPASWYDEITIQLPYGYIYTATWRAYGQMLATWANRIRWLGAGDWHYMDFYKGPDDTVIEGYQAWAETAMRVIQAKCRE
jgi:hypothetical protein